MIAFYPNGEKTPLNNYTDFHIVHKSDGNDELFFSLSTHDQQYPLLMEEMQIDAAGNSWLIKKIYDDDVSCSLNLDALKGTVTKDYSSGSVTLANLLTAVLPSGWTHTGASQSSIRRTITLDFATPFDVLQRAMEVYDCSFVWDVPNKTVTVYLPSTMPVSGEYLTDELNLRKLSYQGDTSDFATRLYAYGKDGMTMENAIVNGSSYGLTYVDNNDYSSKVIASYWTDERYTDPTSLYNDAVKKLAAVAKPIQSYECDAEDLAKESDEYSFLAFQIHRRITLIDRKRNLRVVHQIVEYDEYPEQPSRSKVTLSTVAPTVNSEINSRIADVEQNANNQALSEISRATALLTGAEGGYIVLHYDSNGKPYEMLIMDQPTEAAAQHVWRYNKNGWGFSATGVEGNYTLAATIDGGIIADFIKTGTLDCEDLTVTNLSASDVHLDGVFESEATTSGITKKIVLQNGEIRVYRNGTLSAKLTATENENATLTLNDASGNGRVHLQGTGDIFFYNDDGTQRANIGYDGWQQIVNNIVRVSSHENGISFRDANDTERLRINADGGIYVYDSSGNTAAALGGGGAHQVIVYDANGNEFSKLSGTTASIGGDLSVAEKATAKRLISKGSSYYPLQITDENDALYMEFIKNSGKGQFSVYDAGTERNYVGQGRFSTYNASGTEVDRIAYNGSFFNSTVSKLPTANGDLATTGSNSTPNPSAVSVPTATWTTVGSVTCDPGIWLLMSSVRFASNATGYRHQIVTTSDTGTSTNALMNEDTKSAVNGQYTFTKGTCIHHPTSSITYYLRAYQNSGSQLSCTGRIYAIRIA